MAIEAKGVWGGLQLVGGRRDGGKYSEVDRFGRQNSYHLFMDLCVLFVWRWWETKRNKGIQDNVQTLPNGGIFY